MPSQYKDIDFPKVNYRQVFGSNSPTENICTFIENVIYLFIQAVELFIFVDESDEVYCASGRSEWKQAGED